jgi:Methyltransferase domain
VPSQIGIGGNPTLGGFANLPYYKYGTTVIGLDPALDSPAGARSLQTAQAYAARLGVTLTAQAGAAEALPFADASFDAVVSTLVFCSVKVSFGPLGVCVLLPTDA